MENNGTPADSFWSSARPLACGLAVVAGLLRFVPYVLPRAIFNFTPVGALGIFGGARLKWWQALAIPLLIMVVTDALIWKWKGYAPFDPFVYGCFFVNVLLGRMLLSRTESPLRIGAVSLLASIQFFIVTNFGAWVTDIHSASPTYTSDWNGLFKCYELGIAFYRTEAWPLGFFGNTVLSDLFFTAVLFGAHACLSRTAFPAERIKAAENVALSHG